MMSLFRFSTAAVSGDQFVPLSSARRESGDEAVLRRRLRGVCVLFLAARLSFGAHSYLTGGPPLAAGSWLLLGWLGFVWLILRPVGVLSLRGLRITEFLIFPLVAVDLGISLNQRMSDVATAMAFRGVSSVGEVARLVAAAKDCVTGTLVLMMTYAMLIPATGRRAAVMVCLIAVIPAALVYGNRSTREGLASVRSADGDAVRELRSRDLLGLAVGAGFAIYGTVVISRLRRRVEAAEELGRYRLREKLGSGGMGEVFLAEHKLLRRLCAVKLIRSDQADDPRLLARFEREVQATASLTHWNTIQVFDYGRTADGRFFYVMEYLYGRNLSEIVTQFGPLPPDRTVFILEQICEALRESEAKGLIHRDIKPSNIFLANLGDRFDVVKLLDFGLVRPLLSVADSDHSEQNRISGSPRFLCPEQARGLASDIRGDLYSLGAVAYFLLSGRPPFVSENPLELVIAHATQPPPSLREAGAVVPAELSALVMRCLEKDPSDRFSGPGELLRELHALSIHGHWTWALAEHWWLTCLPEVVEPRPGRPGRAQSLLAADTLSSDLASSAATDPTVIDLRVRPNEGALSVS